MDDSDDDDVDEFVVDINSCSRAVRVDSSQDQPKCAPLTATTSPTPICCSHDTSDGGGSADEPEDAMFQTSQPTVAAESRKLLVLPARTFGGGLRSRTFSHTISSPLNSGSPWHNGSE